MSVRRIVSVQNLFWRLLRLANEAAKPGIRCAYKNVPKRTGKPKRFGTNFGTIQPGEAEFKYPQGESNPCPLAENQIS